MNMHSFRALLGATATFVSLAAALPAQAADFTLSGQIVFHNDVVSIDFSLAAPTSGVTIWTDSWLGGLNFDPVLAVWQKSASDAALLTEVDDNDSIATGQGAYDSGISFTSLAAGSYRLTLAASFNGANGALLSQGFAYDTQTPVPLSLWNQPSYDPNANDQKGGFWQVHLSGVDTVSAVPEPVSAWLLALGLVGVVTASARRRA